MKIVKPLTLGLLHKTYRHRGENHLVVAALGFFPLGREEDRFLTENLQWPRVMSLLPALTPLDEVMPKPRGEVLLSGSAHAPGGRPATAMAVRLQVGAIDKALRVVGDREWRQGLLPWYRVGRPAPFTAMPLVYGRAWGGPKDKANPLGRGYGAPGLAGLAVRAHGAMPNLEYPGQRQRPWRRHPPAGFGPIDITWSPRSDHHGTYDARWLAQDAPGLARDTDFATFNRAPEDQRLPGFFQGGERYCLEGLHPALPRIEGWLPTWRARAFLLGRDRTPDLAEEISLVPDTVWFFPEAELGLVVHRGQHSVADSDALDVQALMVGYEDPSPSREADHYRRVLALRLDPETAALHAFNESQLAPPRSPEFRARREAGKRAAAAADLARRQAMLDEACADFWRESGMMPPPDYVPPKAEPLPLEAFSQEEIESGDLDLSEFVAQAQALGASAEAEGKARRAELEARRGELPPVPEENPDPAAERNAAYERACLAAVDLLPAEQQGVAAQAQAEELTRVLDMAEQAGESFSPERRQEILDALRQFPRMRRQARRASPTPSAPGLPLAAETTQWLGQKVAQWHQGGVGLAGRDLAGADLRGVDFSGADLREVMLEQADLREARFVGADLGGAVLTGARLDGADFSGARLEEANLTGCQAGGARFVKARLARAMAGEADFSGADLSGADLEGLLGRAMVLEGAVLDGSRCHGVFLAEARGGDSRWRGAELEAAVAMGAALPRADFSGARLKRTVFMDADLAASRWEGARLDSIYAGGKSSWRDARLAGVSATACGWHGADLSRTDFTGANLVACEFGNCDLREAVFDGALLSRSLFLAADLRRVRARDADFHLALCRKTDFGGADLSGASFIRAEVGEARFDGSRLDRAQFDPGRQPS